MSETSTNNKRIAINTLLLYVRMRFTMVITLYTSRVVLQVLGADDFGIYNIVGGVVVLFSFLTNAMTSSTQRFLNYNLGLKDEALFYLNKVLKEKPNDERILKNKELMEM